MTPRGNSAACSVTWALAVNVEDFRLEHSPGAPFGLAEIAVAPSVLRDATAGLEKRGWKIASTTND